MRLNGNIDVEVDGETQRGDHPSPVLTLPRYLDPNIWGARLY